MKLKAIVRNVVERAGEGYDLTLVGVKGEEAPSLMSGSLAVRVPFEGGRPEVGQAVTLSLRFGAGAKKNQLGQPDKSGHVGSPDPKPEADAAPAPAPATEPEADAEPETATGDQA